MRIAIAGSSGLIGSALTAALRGDGHQVIRLVRSAPASVDEVAWDPLAPAGGLSPGALPALDAVVNVAGAGVGDRRWTSAYKAEIRRSRVQTTQALVAALTAMSQPPAVLLNGSAIGWYGDAGGREVDESTQAGTGFLPEVVREWESAAEPATAAGIRVVRLRTGLVQSPRGGMLARLLLPFRAGLGARFGPGTQVMSWITLPDYARIVEFLLDHTEISGPVNITTPNPVSNAEYTSALAAALHRPAVFRLPTPVLTLALGEMSSDLLSSARVMPRVLMGAGYQYQLPRLREALAAVLAAS